MMELIIATLMGITLIAAFVVMRCSFAQALLLSVGVALAANGVMLVVLIVKLIVEGWL